MKIQIEHELRKVSWLDVHFDEKERRMVCHMTYQGLVPHKVQGKGHNTLSAICDAFEVVRELDHEVELHRRNKRP